MCHILEQDSLVKYIISFLFFFLKVLKHLEWENILNSITWCIILPILVIPMMKNC